VELEQLVLAVSSLLAFEAGEAFSEQVAGTVATVAQVVAVAEAEAAAAAAAVAALLC
jgi:hypothetical protein